MNADEVIRIVEDKYATCRSYRDSGYVIFDDIKGEKETLQFSTHFMRPEHLVFEFQDYGPGRGKTEKSSTLWSKDGKTWRRWERMKTSILEELKSLDEGWAGTCGCSAGAAGIAISALLPRFYESGRLLQLDDFQLAGSDVVAGIDCHLIKAKSKRLREELIWISATDFSIRRYFRDMSSSGAEQEADLNKLLENKELMEMMTAKGIAPPENITFTDIKLVAEYFFPEVAFDEDFDPIPKPE